MLICILISGCTAQQIEYQALAHKAAITSSADKILLTNILRASRNMAVDYTAITEYTAKEMVSGSLAPKLPFGGDALNTYSLDPTVSVGPGITTIRIQNFGQQSKSFKVIHQEVKTDNFQRLLDAGWPSRLIETFLIQKLIIRGKFKNAVFKYSTEKCVSPKTTNNSKILGYCNQIELANRKCNNGAARIRGRFLNLGNNKCEFLIFQATQSRLDILEIGYDLRQDLKPYLKSVPQNLRDIYEQTEKDLSGDPNRRPLEFKPRSLHEMIRFLGELVQAQLYGTNRWLPKIFLEPDAKNPTPLFVVNRGSPIRARAAISTEFKGESYSLNEADFSNASGHKSLELFTYVRDRLDQAYAAADLPPSNTLVIR